MHQLIYDIPVEVTARQYSVLMNQCYGSVCGRIENGRYFIKAWTQIKNVEKILNETN